MEQDEYGEYPYRYHTALLGMYGIYEPGHFWSSDLPKLFLSLLIVAVASMTVFAYIIRGAFSISAKRKIKELGILKSIGMSRPRQHRHLKRKNSILFLVFLDFPHFFIHSGWQDTLF